MNTLAEKLKQLSAAEEFLDFFGVPYGTAQQFTTTSQPDTFFANNVNGRFHEALLTEACGLMLTQAGGYLLTY